MYTQPAFRQQASNSFKFESLKEGFRCKNKPKTENSAFLCQIDDLNSHSNSSNALYVARVHLGIESSAVVRRDLVTTNPSAVEQKTAPITEFVAFALISEVNNIDQRYTENLCFRLCVGKEGYINSRFSNETTMNYTGPENSMRLNDEMPAFLPISKENPCVSLCFLMQDLRHIMYRNNLVRNFFNNLVS